MPAVRFGIVILPELRWKDAAGRWQRAEEYGFDHAWTYDQLGWRQLVDGPWFDAVPTLTAAALVTSRIRLGPLVASPNFRHPVSFARQLLALDDVSGGRLLVGLGAGAFGDIFDNRVLGGPRLPARARTDRFAEFAALLDLLLSGDHVSWDGAYYTAVDARTRPGCVQSPRAPFVVAANGRRSMAIAARHGDGWVTSGAREVSMAQWWRAVGEKTRQFDDALAAAGRPAGAVGRYLSLDSAEVFSLSSTAAFADAAGRAAELGFTDVITHWPRPDSPYAGTESVLETVAAEHLTRRPPSPLSAAAPPPSRPGPSVPPPSPPSVPPPFPPGPSVPPLCRPGD
jgi:alkanesulfonate monooxygenase SsuD/methylene tetrahydromethanopterin reductase-like flavin-dependent oxidoreductase (luciferase family)